MTIEAHLLDKVTGLVGRRDLTQREEQDWWTGPADGGPNGDGLYPRTDSTGFVRLLPSPQRMAAAQKSQVVGLFVGVDLASIGPDVTRIITTGYYRIGEGGAAYDLDPLSAYQPDRTNQLASPNDLSVGGWFTYDPGLVTATFDGDFTVIEEHSPGYGRWLRQFPGFAPAITTLEFEVRKDGVPASTRKSIARLVLRGGVTKNVDVLIDTMAGTITDGADVVGSSSRTYDKDIQDLGDRWLVRLSADAPIGTTSVDIEIYPANGPNNNASAAATGSIAFRNMRLYAGTSPSFKPSVDARTSILASNGRVFAISTEQVARPQMCGVTSMVADNTAAFQAFFSLVTRTRFPEANLTCNVGITAPVKWGPSSATQYYTGHMIVRALGPMFSMIDWISQREVVVAAKIELYGFGDTNWADRKVMFGDTYTDCRSLSFTADAFKYFNFRYAGFGCYNGNSNYVTLGKRYGFYCGSGAADMGMSLTAIWDSPVHKGFAGSAEQYTELNVSAIPEDATLMGVNDQKKNWKVWLNGRPYLVLDHVRAAGFDGSVPSPGKIQVYPWVDLRVQGTMTLDYMFGGLGYLAGGNGGEFTGNLIAQISGAALVSDSLYGGQYTLSTDHCGLVHGCGLRKFGVHQPDEIENIYNENTRANVVIANGIAADGGKVHIDGQHQEPSASYNWTFSPVDDQTTYRPSPTPGMYQSTVMHNHRRCAYQKPNPENVRRATLDGPAFRSSRDANACKIDPNAENVWIAERGLTGGRDVFILDLNGGLRRNQGYSGARYEAGGLLAGSPPGGIIRFRSISGLAVNGQTSTSFISGEGSVPFGNLKRTAMFSIEWDRATGGWLVALMAGDITPLAFIPDGQNPELNALYASMRAAGQMLTT